MNVINKGHICYCRTCGNSYNEREIAELRAELAAAKAREKALRRFYDDFWFHAEGADGESEWIIPKNELEVADEEYKAVMTKHGYIDDAIGEKP